MAKSTKPVASGQGDTDRKTVERVEAVFNRTMSKVSKKASLRDLATAFQKALVSQVCPLHVCVY